MLMKFCLLFFAVFFFFPPSSQAVNVERLVMPGKVIEGHAKYENECEKCHEPFDKASQRLRCLACHKKVAADLEEGKGFHGRRKEIKGKECKHCHTEHKGRDADIINLDKVVFDHNETDFPLKGRHLKVICQDCHKNKKFREAPSLCIECHRNKEPHSGRLGQECEKCHTNESWKEFQFDHTKTKFNLEGAHAKVSCRSCHPNQVWKETPKECYSCHKINDVHTGRYGIKCENCHTVNPQKQQQIDAAYSHIKSGWKPYLFDHSKTKFALQDKHRKVRCDLCHKGKIYEEKLAQTCVTCHSNDDRHKKKFGEKCETCHNPKGWKKTTFNHDKTKFPLKDKHASVLCERCHKGTLEEQKIGLTCVSCHRLDDHHKKRFGEKCETCHLPTEWKKPVFDHDKTKFPLKFKHLKVSCDKCHTPEQTTLKLAMTCETCHLQHDVHKGQQGKTCGKCHNPQGWRVDVFFSHDLTGFPLIGLHAVVSCEQCHLTEKFKDTSRDCVSCHEKNDKHKQRLGPKCAMCHNPNGWKLWRFDHNTQTKYTLTGKHDGLECMACHQQQVKDKFNVPDKCVNCHAKDDVHRGKFGRFCGRCHVPKSFKEVKLIP